MEVKAITKNARMSAKKMRDLAREMQGLPVGKATEILKFTPKKAAYLIGKTLKSAVANAEHNCQLDADSLVIKSVVIDEGPTLRRIMPRARGSANPIHKRTSHITVIVTDAAVSA